MGWEEASVRSGKKCLLGQKRVIFTEKNKIEKAQKITTQRRNIKDMAFKLCLLRENFTQTKKKTARNAETYI